MSLFSKRVSELELEGIEVHIENGNDPARHKAPKSGEPTTTTLVVGREIAVKAGDKILKVGLSKDGKHLEIEYLVKDGVRKTSPILRLSL
ncbi:MAG TPA: hypothetical protein VFH61_13080 [Thermoleophilia bacterium]|nr:hypothetical protein [Thermoleophilia bacterium]